MISGRRGEDSKANLNGAEVFRRYGEFRNHEQEKAGGQ